MTRIGESSELLKCSFCGKSQKQVKKLIAGPGVYICDECIELCNEIIIEELSESSNFTLTDLPKPHEIFEFLNQYERDQEAHILNHPLPWPDLKGQCPGSQGLQGA